MITSLSTGIMITSLDCWERQFDDVVDAMVGAVNEDLRLLPMAQETEDDAAVAVPSNI